MSAVKRCLTCKPEDTAGSKFAPRRGFTRHKNRICSKCRRAGNTASNGWVYVSIVANYRGRGA